MKTPEQVAAKVIPRGSHTLRRIELCEAAACAGMREAYNDVLTMRIAFAVRDRIKERLRALEKP